MLCSAWEVEEAGVTTGLLRLAPWDLPMNLVVLIVDVAGDRHLVARELHVPGLQLRVHHGREAVLVDDAVQPIAIGLGLYLVDQDPDVVDPVKAFGLLEEATTLDDVQELFSRHGFQFALGIRGQLVG